MCKRPLVPCPYGALCFYTWLRFVYGFLCQRVSGFSKARPSDRSRLLAEMTNSVFADRSTVLAATTANSLSSDFVAGKDVEKWRGLG